MEKRNQKSKIRKILLGKVYFRRVGTAPERQGLLAAAGRKEKKKKLLFLDVVCMYDLDHQGRGADISYVQDKSRSLS